MDLDAGECFAGQYVTQKRQVQYVVMIAKNLSFGGIVRSLGKASGGAA